MDSSLPATRGVVVCAPTEALQKLLAHTYFVLGGTDPKTRSESASAVRAHYSPMNLRFIINAPSQAMKELLGPHSVALQFCVRDRKEAARLVVSIFNNGGYEAFAHIDPEPEYETGFLSAVSVPALGGIAFILGPRNEDLKNFDLTKLPKHEQWKYE